MAKRANIYVRRGELAEMLDQSVSATSYDSCGFDRGAMGRRRQG